MSVREVPSARGVRGRRRQLRYERVIELTQRVIREQGLEPGDLLPPIHSLAAMANVSPISVRRALDELERAGVVQRHQGVGTFVASPRILAEPARAGGLLATLTRAGTNAAVTTRLLGIDRGVATPTICRVLGIGPTDPVWRVTRLRLIGRRPRILELSVLPAGLVPLLDDSALAEGASLYDFLATRYALIDDHEDQYLEVVVPDETETSRLRLRPDQQIVRIRGISFTPEGVPFDCFQQSYPASDFVFYVSGRGRKQLLQASDVRDWNVAPEMEESGVRVR